MRKIPTKVVIECTAKSYVTKVFCGDEVLSERAMEMQSPGRAKGASTGDVFDDLPRFPTLAEQVDDCDPFSISTELMLLKLGDSEDLDDHDEDGEDQA